MNVPMIKSLHVVELKMAKDDVIIMDNCSTHHSRAVKARLQELSIEVSCLLIALSSTLLKRRGRRLREN
jgi:UDP-glucose 4-epimerase